MGSTVHTLNTMKQEIRYLVTSDEVMQATTWNDDASRENSYGMFLIGLGLALIFEPFFVGLPLGEVAVASRVIAWGAGPVALFCGARSLMVADEKREKARGLLETIRATCRTTEPEDQHLMDADLDRWSEPRRSVVTRVLEFQIPFLRKLRTRHE